ncbi:proteasome regulatory particle base subunit [Coemansia sp. RSA 1646]|nr:proteasome regulatory particle base subunit [Coemansia sp. RSA 1646]KAJ2217907.1 proteasome regulatory particle base subunit [Coemansia sp. RSA 487]
MKPNALLLCISTVSGDLLAQNVKVKVMERTGDKLFDQQLSGPGTLEGAPKISATTPLSITFDVVTAGTEQEAATVDQAFVSLHNLATGDEVGLVAKQTKRGSYKMDLSRKNFRTHFSSAPGTYNAALILGSFTDGGVFYELGDIIIAGKEKQKRDVAVYGAKPEIRHRFSDAQKMPNAAVSLAFTAAAVAPLVVLLGAWARLGVNAADLKKEAVGSVAFMGLVSAYMALAMAYWVGVKLFPTLAYALALALPTYLAGQYALSRRIQDNIGSSR